MVFFHTKKSQPGNIFRWPWNGNFWYTLWPFEILYLVLSGQLGVFIWYIFPRFGMFSKENIPNVTLPPPPQKRDISKFDFFFDVDPASQPETPPIPADVDDFEAPGSILQNSISAENFSDSLCWTNFNQNNRCKFI
jgi:hypothetical protein